jgi:hypothetical protein
MNSPFKSPAVIGIIAFFVIYSSLYWYYNLAEVPHFLQYLESMYHLTIFVALLGFIMDRIAEFNQQQVTLNDQQETGFLDIQALFLQYYPESIPLYKEIYRQDKDISKLIVPTNINYGKKRMVDSFICITIIKRIENIYFIMIQDPNYQQSDIYHEWVGVWRNWFMSPTLREEWQDDKNILFPDQLNDFIDQVIIGGKNQTNSEYKSKMIHLPINKSNSYKYFQEA